MPEKIKGSVVVYILVAIALFSALAYAMFRSSQNAGSADTVRNRLQIAQIDDYMDSIEKAVDSVRSRKGCSDDQISFDNENETVYKNLSAPADGSCNIFSANGGGLKWRSEKNGNVESRYLFSGSFAIQSGTGPQDGELIVILPNIPKSICLAYNKKQNYFKFPEIPREASLTMPFNVARYFTGTYSDFPFNCNDGADPTAACALIGLKYDHLCVAGSDSNKFYIYNFIHYRPATPATAN